MYILIYGIIFLVLIFALVPFSSSFLAIFGLILAVIMVIAIVKRNATMINKIKDKYPADALIIQNVDVGGVMKIANIDGYDEDLELKVIGKNLYVEGDYSWFELECLKSDGEKIWIDVDDDDELIVSVVLKKLRQNETKLSASLKTIEENEKGSILYKEIEKSFSYIDSGNAVFYKHCDDKKPEKLLYWDFRNGNYILSIENWLCDGNSKYEYFYSQLIKPHAIVVYSTGKEGNK